MKVISLTNFMELKIFTGDVVDLSDTEIKTLGSHNFKPADPKAEVKEVEIHEPVKTSEEVHAENAAELERIEKLKEPDAEIETEKETKVMKTKDVKKK